MHTLVLGRTDQPGKLTVIYDKFATNPSWIDGDIAVLSAVRGRLALTDLPRYRSVFPEPLREDIVIKPTSVGVILFNDREANLWRALQQEVGDDSASQQLKDLVTCMRTVGATYDFCRHLIEAYFNGRPYSGFVIAEMFSNVFNTSEVMTLAQHRLTHRHVLL